jgi:hypothetical protein
MRSDRNDAGRGHYKEEAVMERAPRITMVFGTLALLSACGGPPPTGELAPGEVGQTSAALLGPDPCIEAAMFTHIANEANIGGPNGYSTAIDHPSTNGNPRANLIVTPNWTPNGGAEVRDYHPVGVWYNSAIARWSVYHADNAPMPPGTGFNVRVGRGFAVRSPDRTGAIGFHISALPVTAKLFATASYNPAGLPLSSNNNYSPLAVSLRYPFGPEHDREWYLWHSDELPFYWGTNFFIAEERCATGHTTTAGSVVGDDYVLDAARVNGNPGAIVIAMRQVPTRWPGDVRIAPPGHLVVRYDGSRARWLVRGWSNSSEQMPIGTTMNIVVQTPAP